MPAADSRSRREFLRFLAASPYVAALGGVAAYLRMTASAQVPALSAVDGVLTDPAQYQDVLAEIAAHGGTTMATRRKLAGQAYARTAAYGHFGRNPDADGGFSWEKTDIADIIKAKI